MRLSLALIVVTGCSRILGLDSPQRIDAGGTDDGRRSDGQLADSGGNRDGTQSATCPLSYSLVTGLSTSRYRLSMSNATWDVAQAACLAEQPMDSTRYTHLAVITDDAELSAIASANPSDAWLGLSDRITEGTYLWVTNEVTTYPPATGTPWGTNEPQTGTTTNCVLLVRSAAQLKVQQCNNQRAYICECDAYAADPSRY